MLKIIKMVSEEATKKYSVSKETENKLTEMAIKTYQKYSENCMSNNSNNKYQRYTIYLLTVLNVNNFPISLP